MVEKISGKKNIKAVLRVSGDKSISHRAVIFGSIAEGITEISGFLAGEDCIRTIEAFRKMGVLIEQFNDRVIIHGAGLRGLKEPASVIDAGNSGTTMRLLAGVLAGQHFNSILMGDESLSKRPMKRIVEPLQAMGAFIESGEGAVPPLKIKGSPLKGICYEMPVLSAQVKSAVLLAGLYAEGETAVIEPSQTRNHTEIMVKNFGGNIAREDNIIRIKAVNRLQGGKISLPTDISSAAYFIAAGCLCENSEITLKDVDINPTRSGLLTALKQMGANLIISNERSEVGEAVADITAKTSQLKGIEISGHMVPLMIDELPVLAVCALQAEGKTIIKDAAELKVKESNRIKAMVTELSKFGANIEETEDGMIIEGGAKLKGCDVECYKDHRVAMSLAICALLAEGETVIHGAECVNISFPEFFEMLYKL
ncbi:3-phosphoshikimate 1-carboxyvinyltransferase [Tyzzerella sp. OttesenSCG-928-J15]|nr:3-phosphoshikimate 1-carboxyvinyltransferase [Tyzzerella sp. OttesenSCG-928-J15]